MIRQLRNFPSEFEVFIAAMPRSRDGTPCSRVIDMAIDLVHVHEMRTIEASENAVDGFCDAVVIRTDSIMGHD